jgi:hypothetical protein
MNISNMPTVSIVYKIHTPSVENQNVLPWCYHNGQGKSVYFLQEKNEVDDVNKACELFLLWSESDPLLYRWCRLSNPIKKKTIPGIPIDVAVNYADFAISI